MTKRVRNFINTKKIETLIKVEGWTVILKQNINQTLISVTIDNGERNFGGSHTFDAERIKKHKYINHVSYEIARGIKNTIAGKG